MSPELVLLAATAASLGVLHTVIGPDHYVPFAALARARRWSLPRTLLVTLGCGAGHVAGSVLLGGAALVLGWGLGGVGAIESLRGDLAAWFLVAFGLVYGVWGLRRASRRRTHTHRHAHVDGTVHVHEHDHRGADVHLHGDPARATPWILFVLFVLGPCEALIPLVFPAVAEAGWLGGVSVVAVFGIATVATMMVAVSVVHRGLAMVRLGTLERYGHSLAGLALAACGLAILAGL